MENRIKAVISIVRGKFIIIGIALGAAFWFIESVMHVYVFHGDDLIESVFSPGFHEAWMRLVIVGMFISFGIYGQWLINARRKAQTELSLANAELAQIFETSADGMRVVDREFNMLRANDTFCRLAGVKKKEAIGRKCYDVFRGPLCHGQGCPLTRILAGEERVECDAVKVRDGANEIPCIVTATPFRGPTGEIIGIVEDFKDISSRKHTEEELRQSRRQLRELASYLESAREKERTRIAREIHDELGQSLTALKMELHWCIRRLPQDDSLLAERAKKLLKLVDENVHLVQRISSELRPGLLDNLGLSAAIEWQAGQLTERTGVKCDFLSDPEDIILDQTRSTAIFRIFQETCTNIARHSDATKAEIVLKELPAYVELRITDNGRGITQKQISNPKSFGLMGIRERALSFGGEVEISGNEKKGTTVRVRIPKDGTGEAKGDKSPGGR
ncbi:MAG: PAS domain S-box protein [Desulfobacteraceae bacterium]|jgi:PAS domain S-box-containing protein|nr:MAG: PAS domain S-box protein [Desulfobacteraceae bacterium]